MRRPKRRHEKDVSECGVILVGTVGLMIFLGLFAAVGTSLVASSAGSHEHLILDTQALGIAQAGAEWYLKQLEGDTDWTNETNQSHSFANGDFQITILGAPTASEVTFTSTGVVPSGLVGVKIRRHLTLTAQKLPKAFRFALFQGSDPGPNFLLQNRGANPTVITGDVWSRGSVRINGVNTVTGGRVYVPTTENVTGTGTYTAVKVAAPYLKIPVLDASPYIAEMKDYDKLLDANTSSKNFTISTGTFDLNTNPNCSGGICEFRSFTTRGNVAITGSGTIVADRNILLHGQNGLAPGSSLKVAPSGGGRIVFVSNRNIIVGSSNDFPVIQMGSGVTLYSRSLASNNRFIRIRRAHTTLISTRLLAQRRILIQQGADLTADSLVFLNYPGNNNNNLLDIIGGPGVTSVDGTLISLSRRNNGLRIRNGGNNKKNVVVTGLVYAYGTPKQGRCQLQDATITGAVVCNRYNNNRVRNIAVTYDADQLPENLPEGFDGFVSIEPNSWDGV